MSYSLRYWLVKKFGLRVVGEGFDKDFPELSKVTEHYQSLPFEQARLVLESELSRSGERVQLIGLTFPLSLLSVATPIIIISIQIYLLLYVIHISNATTRLDIPIPWIALHENSFAKIVSVTTILILPAVTTILLGITPFSWWRILFVVPVSIAGFFLMSAIWQFKNTIS
jgi:hypothetical protein